MAASLFASGGMPPACKYGHDWTPGAAGYYLSWMPCLCVPGGLGHHRVRCRGDDEMCTAVWHDPPHVPGTEIRGYPQPRARDIPLRL